MTFPHIDFATLPDEFATKAEGDFTKENVSAIVDDVKTTTTIDYKEGDVCGIEMGNVVYALKDLCVKLYEEIIDLKNRIKILEG